MKEHLESFTAIMMSSLLERATREVSTGLDEQRLPSVLNICGDKILLSTLGHFVAVLGKLPFET
jgi:hypothetical protein